jgi:transposase
MSIVQDVARAWKGVDRKMRRWAMSEAMHSRDAELRMRCRILRNLVRGESPTVIAKILGVGRSRVYGVAHRLLDDGVQGLCDRRAENGELKVREAYVATVLSVLAGSPQQHGYQRPTWTQELLILVAHARTGVKISRTTMSRLLAAEGVRRGRPKPTVACPWPAARKTRRLREIRRLERRLPAGEALLYVDEVDIHLNPKIGDDWMLRGQQKTVLTPGQNVKRYLAGALNARSGRLAWVQGPRKTSALFIALVDHLVKRAYARARVIHLVLDNFRIHSSRAVAAACERWGHRVRFHFLPPYCPDHNRIERLWKDLHDNVTRNHTCREMAELMRSVNDYLTPRRRTGKHCYTQAI